MKQILLLGMALLLICGTGVAWWLHTAESQVEPEAVVSPTAPTTLRGQVTDIDTSQMMVDGPGLIRIVGEDSRPYTIAVPSMGRNLCAASGQLTDPNEIAIGDTVEVHGQPNEAGEIVPCEGDTHYLHVWSTVKNTDFGFSFVYEKGAPGYTQLTEETDLTPPLLYQTALVPTPEYWEYQTADEAREAPAQITLDVYANPERSSAAIWHNNHPEAAFLSVPHTEAVEAVVGGANAVTYTADGLYPLTVYVVAYGNNIYVLVAQADDGTENIAQDFEQFVHSFTFIKAKNQG